MKLTFRIRYRTVWGENLCVLLNDDETQIISLSTRNGDEWQGSFEYIPVGSNQLVTYRYAVYRDNICIRKELGAISHLFSLGNAQQNHYVIDDCWRDLPADSYRYSSAFNSIYTPQSYNKLSDSVGSCITFRALCPELGNRNQALGLIGSCNALGSWEYCRPLRMQEVRPNVWHITLDASSLQLPFEYKFVAINAESGAVEEWESRPNRLFNVQPLQRGETYLPMETEVFFALPARKFAGSAIPVFSLRSEGSCGVGDFGDLKTFVSWAADTAQHVVQILPINDTSITGSWTDSYPYNSISIYAFHPMYIDLRQLPALADAQFASRFEEERARLNALSVVDYEAVNRLKQSYLKEVYRQEGENVLKSDEFNTFFADNRHWLQPYAAFSYLRDLYGTSDFHCWEAYNKYDEEEIQQLCSSESDAYTFIGYYYYMQYLLHVQLLAVAEYARRKGVILKGDIPIGISRTSVESWVEPYYFNMNGQAGAPPDAFSVNGQNWGFPTYNWEVMEKDNYLWWRRRFAKMAEYFTAYRIDHILGFFRIWEIPTHSVHGLLGQFVPSLPMSADEIRSFGLNFRPDFMLRPFISEYILNTVFGEQSDYVRETFVRPLHHDLYEMRPEFDTQRKVEAFFEGKTDSESIWLKEKLYALISDVLFVADRNNPELYHPRIAVQNDYIFKQLAEQEQEAFNHLYNHYYYQRHNEFWYHEAMKKLPVLTQSTPMLVCGEDLGMVPDCVSWVMNELQILSLEIQRMPKAIGREFGCLNEYPFRSVCTIGTHDMPTLRGWWEEDAALTERFYHNELHHWGEVPKHAPGWLCKEIIEQHLQSPSMLCVLAWQDWTSIDESLRNPDVQAERINVPANPHNYWQWRMHITLEELMQADELNDAIRQMIQSSDRNTAC
ncbi:4-alpha-glucanotransferase [Bacteroides caecicola]|uniref:4-alpha-glucanotransferase n=1 Tax=Bacteroides caecicola TaxID=1462569 RepID=UPI002013250B|nr:4-alpha-glucanotransferase [Bacteroides caecicola]MCL1626929.1 4-alpha-glucanotransferase [Bacteroides caecicola]